MSARVLKKLSAFLLTIFALTAPLAHSQNEETITINYGLFPDDYPPLFQHNGSQGIIQLTLEAISERSRFRFEPKLYPFNRLIQMVGAGELDLEAWTSSAWRSSLKGKVYFTDPVTEHCEVIILTVSSNLQVNTPEDLIGKRLGVVQDFTFMSFQKFFDNQQIKRVDSSNEERVLNLLKHGRSDAVLMDALIAQYLMKTAYSGIFKTGKHFDCVPVSFMFSKKSEAYGREINQILQKMKQEGVIERILKKFR